MRSYLSLFPDGSHPIHLDIRAESPAQSTDVVAAHEHGAATFELIFTYPAETLERLTVCEVLTSTDGSGEKTWLVVAEFDRVPRSSRPYNSIPVEVLMLLDEHSGNAEKAVQAIFATLNHYDCLVMSTEKEAEVERRWLRSEGGWS